MILTEGIVHLEDLDIKDFIKAVRNIATMQASEKLDGSNLWAGLDERGELFTSRAGKRDGAEKFYSEADYPAFAAYNGFRATHAALMAKEADVKKALGPGDTFEVEVLFGRQPNAVTYGLGGKNFIAILRGVEGTSDTKIDQLTAVLNNSEVTVRTPVIDTTDGITLDRKMMEHVFRFVGVQKIKPEMLKSIDVEEAVKELEDYLDNASPVEGLSNFELMTTSLGSIPKAERAEAKEAKETVLANVKNKFKVRIKKELLDKFVSKIKPALAADDLSGDEDNGIEGVVLRDPATGEQIKIVDKDSFTTINQFNFAVRNQIGGMVRSTDDSASLESRGGLTGVMKIRIAEILGNKDLAIGRGAKKIFNDNKGDNPTSTLRNVAKSLNGADYIGAKKKIAAIVAATIDELDSMRETFNKTKDDVDTYRLKLKSGKAMGLSPEIVKRTMMTFAETRRNLVELLTKIKGTDNFEQLVAVLYGRAARAAHAEGEDDSIAEALDVDGGALLEARTYTDVARYQAVPDAFTLLNIYIGTFLLSALVYKADDKVGIRLLKDKPHYRLTKHKPEMSALNFWGYPVWRSSSPAVKKLIGKKTAAEIFKQARKVPPNWFKHLHMDLSFGKDVDIDWGDHLKTIRVLMQYPSVSTDRLNTLIAGVMDYETLSHDEKVKLVAKLYLFIMQFVPTSPLLTRLRVIQDNLLLNATGKNTQMVVTESLLKSIVNEEEGDGGSAPATPGSSNNNGNGEATATKAADIAEIERKITKNSVVIRRKRNPEIKKKRFSRPKD